MWKRVTMDRDEVRRPPCSKHECIDLSHKTSSCDRIDVKLQKECAVHIPFILSELMISSSLLFICQFLASLSVRGVTQESSMHADRNWSTWTMYMNQSAHWEKYRTETEQKSKVRPCDVISKIAWRKLEWVSSSRVHGSQTCFYRIQVVSAQWLFTGFADHCNALFSCLLGSSYATASRIHFQSRGTLCRGRKDQRIASANELIMLWTSPNHFIYINTDRVDWIIA